MSNVAVSVGGRSVSLDAQDSSFGCRGRYGAPELTGTRRSGIRRAGAITLPRVSRRPESGVTARIDGIGAGAPHVEFG